MLAGFLSWAWFLFHKKPAPLEPAKEKPGLEVKFKVGQQIPWCGIWFSVSKVEKEKLELTPVGMTWKKAKQIKEAQYA